MYKDKIYKSTSYGIYCKNLDIMVNDMISYLQNKYMLPEGLEFNLKKDTDIKIYAERILREVSQLKE